MSREAADRLLGVLGATIGIPDLRLDEVGCCALAFDEVVVNLEADPDGRQRFLYVSVGRCRRPTRPSSCAPSALVWRAVPAAVPEG